MTRDDIMHLANETAGRDGWGCEGHLQRFAARLIAAEREACACIAERAGYRSNGTPAHEHIAAAIRARSNNNARHRNVPRQSLSKT